MTAKEDIFFAGEASRRPRRRVERIFPGSYEPRNAVARLVTDEGGTALVAPELRLVS